jgi:hypothetical protein
MSATSVTTRADGTQPGARPDATPAAAREVTAEEITAAETTAQGATAALWYPHRLDALHERVAPGSAVPSPTGLVLASHDKIPDAPVHPLNRFGLAFRRAAAEERATAPATTDRFAAGLLALHRELLRRTLDHAVVHLGSRTSGGGDLLSKQLVQAGLADVAIVLAEEEAALDAGGGDPPLRWRSHRRLTAAGRVLLRLLGASGFLADGPGGELYLAEAAGNVYLHPGTEQTDD